SFFDEMQNDQMDEDIRQQEEPDSLQFEIRKVEDTEDDEPELEVPARMEHRKPDLADNKDRMRMINQQENERVKRLKSLSLRLNNLDELEKTPAYLRRNVRLEDTPDSAEHHESKYSLNDSERDGLQIKRNNSFLHDNVD
ncbi:MAG TPA: hypothetical protein PLI03_01720, partial [Chitinophagales bacterium]|nr:hypothetical protein [Chitinophagales bacterium]